MPLEAVRFSNHRPFRPHVIVGLVFDLHDAYPWLPGDPPDAHAEYEPEETVQALEAALVRLGHEPFRIGTPADLLRSGPGPAEAAVNIAEGAWTRNREGWAPTLLEMWGVPYVGSDALALSLSLDKLYTKELAAAEGVPTPAFRSYDGAGDIARNDLPAPFPLFVKPRFEGTAKGIRPGSVVHDHAQLVEQVRFVTTSYRQAALVEAFVSGGGEYTVALAGHPVQALPLLQRALDRETGIGLHALQEEGRGWYLGGSIDAALETRLQRLALTVFHKLGCRDFARVDFRVDGHGIPWFLEINPLPTFAPDGTFAVIAELAGRTYEELLSEVLDSALNRAVAQSSPRYA